MNLTQICLGTSIILNMLLAMICVAQGIQVRALIDESGAREGIQDGFHFDKLEEVQDKHDALLVDHKIALSAMAWVANTKNNPHQAANVVKRALAEIALTPPQSSNPPSETL